MVRWLVLPCCKTFLNEMFLTAKLHNLTVVSTSLEPWKTMLCSFHTEEMEVRKCFLFSRSRTNLSLAGIYTELAVLLVVPFFLFFVLPGFDTNYTEVKEILFSRLLLFEFAQFCLVCAVVQKMHPACSAHKGVLEHSCQAQEVSDFCGATSDRDEFFLLLGYFGSPVVQSFEGMSFVISCSIAGHISLSD